MSHTFGDFSLLDSIQTENFILLQFEKKWGHTSIRLVILILA
jgi:hypothetical protein